MTSVTSDWSEIRRLDTSIIGRVGQRAPRTVFEAVYITSHGHTQISINICCKRKIRVTNEPMNDG